MTHNKPPFIVLEGLSGCGKTTIGRMLAERMYAEFYVTPPNPFSRVRESIDKDATLSARFLFYLAGLLQASQEITEILQTRGVVCDRYVHTTICFHQAVGIDVSTLAPNFIRNVLQPDHVFLITCTQSTRIRRLVKRGLNYNDLLERNDAIEQRFLASYRSFGLTEVDNSLNDPEIVISAILEHMDKR